jgi:hypothetical protein
MLFADMLVAMAAAVFIVWIVSRSFGTKGPWDSFLWFVLVVALFAWAGGIWIMPFGPRWWGIGWFPIIWMGILVALLLTSVSPRTSRKSEAATNKAAVSEHKAEVDIILWVLIALLFAFAISHYTSYHMGGYGYPSVP